MSELRLIQWYHNYALVIGVTSYRLVAGRLRQTWLTRFYVLALNVFQLLTLPLTFWLSTNYLNTIKWFPNFILFTTYLMYSVSCAAVAYTVMSRGSRDKALVEVERIVAKLKLQETRRIGQIKSIGCSLDFMFYLKFGTVLYLCVSSLLMCILMPYEGRWTVILSAFLFNNAMNMPVVSTYRYFLALWNIACCYQYINCRLREIICSAQSSMHKSSELDELHRLWSLHTLLGRCTLKMNKSYGLLMLAARFDYVTFIVVDGYWGLLLWFTSDMPIYLFAYGSATYMVRSLDFYLMDMMCDLTIQYQSCPHNDVSEGLWFKELNAYLLYASTLKLSIWVCDLYEVNRKFWFQMLGSIFTFSILLIQFHLIKRNKYSL